MPQSASIAELAKALCQAQAMMKPAVKDTVNPFFKSKYADLASVWDAAREPLTKYGLSVVQIPTSGEEGLPTVMTMLLHSSGEWISGDLTLKAVKNDPQSVGSAITYARRYALSAMTGVATEDDDGEAASAPAPQKAVQAPYKPMTKVAMVEPHHAETDGFIWRLNGKHKGERLEDLPESYLVWAAKDVKVADHRAAAQMELDRRNGQEIFASDPEEDLIEEDRYPVDKHVDNLAAEEQREREIRMRNPRAMLQDSEDQAAPGGAPVPSVQGEAERTPLASGSGPSEGIPPDVPPSFWVSAAVLNSQFRHSESIREWEGVENASLEIHDQGAFTPAEWATNRAVSAETKKHLTPKKK